MRLLTKEFDSASDMMSLLKTRIMNKYDSDVSSFVKDRVDIASSNET